MWRAPNSLPRLLAALHAQLPGELCADPLEQGRHASQRKSGENQGERSGNCLLPSITLAAITGMSRGTKTCNQFLPPPSLQAVTGRAFAMRQKTTTKRRKSL